MLTRKQHELLTFIDRHLRQTGFSPSFEEMKEGLSLKSKSGIHRLILALEERGFLRRRHHRARALEVVRHPDEATTKVAANEDTIRPVSQRPEQRRPDRERPDQEHQELQRIARDEEEQGLQPGGQNFSPNVIRGDFTGRFPGVRAASEAAAIHIPLYGRIAAGMPIEALNESITHIEVPSALLGGGDHYALEVAGDSMVDAGIFDGDTVIIRKGDVAENGQIVVALVDENEVTLKRLRRRGNSIALEPANARHETRIFPADRVKVQGRLIALMRRYQ